MKPNSSPTIHQILELFSISVKQLSSNIEYLREIDPSHSNTEYLSVLRHVADSILTEAKTEADYILYGYSDYLKAPSRKDTGFSSLRDAECEKIYKGGKVEAYVLRNSKIENLLKDINSPVDLLTFVIPTRNGASLLPYSITAAIRDLAKSKKIIPNICLIANNSEDATIQVAKTLLQNLSQTGFTLYEIPSFRTGNLPNNLNTVFFDQLEQLDHIFRRNANIGHFFTFLDDDAVIQNIDENTSGYQLILDTLKSNYSTRMIGGHCVDSRKNISYFHFLANASLKPDVVSRMLPRPYAHSEGGIIRYSDYPETGLSVSGLAGIPLNGHALSKVESHELSSIKFWNAPIRTIPSVMFQHPTSNSLFEWTTRYYGYHLAWEQAESIVSAETLDVWKKWRLESKKDALSRALLPLLSIEELVGHILIKDIFHANLKRTNNISYDMLRTLTLRPHHNLSYYRK